MIVINDAPVQQQLDGGSKQMKRPEKSLDSSVRDFEKKIKNHVIPINKIDSNFKYQAVLTKHFLELSNGGIIAFISEAVPKYVKKAWVWKSKLLETKLFSSKKAAKNWSIKDGKEKASNYWEVLNVFWRPQTTK